jgi:hypothetical protein
MFHASHQPPVDPAVRPARSTRAGRLLSARFLDLHHVKDTQSARNNNAHRTQRGDFRRQDAMSMPERCRMVRFREFDDTWKAADTTSDILLTSTDTIFRTCAALLQPGALSGKLGTGNPFLASRKISL